MFTRPPLLYGVFPILILDTLEFIVIFELVVNVTDFLPIAVSAFIVPNVTSTSNALSLYKPIYKLKPVFVPNSKLFKSYDTVYVSVGRFRLNVFCLCSSVLYELIGIRFFPLLVFCLLNPSNFNLPYQSALSVVCMLVPITGVASANIEAVLSTFFLTSSS